MPQPQAPMYRRIYARLTADRGPGKKKLWVLLAIPLAVLFGLCLATAAAGYLYFAHGLPSIEWARHYPPSLLRTRRRGGPPLPAVHRQHGVERRRAAGRRVLQRAARGGAVREDPAAPQAGGDRLGGQGLLRARRSVDHRPGPGP